MASNITEIEQILAARRPNANYEVTVGRSVSTGRRIKIDTTETSLILVGSTGQGKTTLFTRLFLQNLGRRPTVVIDPIGHWSKEALLPNIDPKFHHDTIYFAPGDPTQHLRFNPFDPGKALSPDEESDRADALFEIFKFLWIDAYHEPVPIMEMVLHSLCQVMTRSKIDGKPATFIDAVKFLINKEFRQRLVQKLDDEILKEFWMQVYQPGTMDRSSFNKIYQFIMSPIVRRGICEPRSSFYLDEILKSQNKTLIVDLGGLGEKSKDVIGGLIISLVVSELLRRERSHTEELIPFNLIVDEADRYASGQMFDIILSKLRQQRSSAYISHQHIGQIKINLQPALFQQHVGCFQIDPLTASAGIQKFFQKKDLPKNLTARFADLLTEQGADLVRVPKYHFWLRAIQPLRGSLTNVDLIRTYKAPEGDPANAEAIKSAQSRYDQPQPKYDIEQIFEEIKRYQEAQDETQTEVLPTRSEHLPGLKADWPARFAQRPSVVFDDL